jgi:hypothetical protein
VKRDVAAAMPLPRRRSPEGRPKGRSVRAQDPSGSQAAREQRIAGNCSLDSSALGGGGGGGGGSREQEQEAYSFRFCFKTCLVVCS